MCHRRRHHQCIILVRSVFSGQQSWFSEDGTVRHEFRRWKRLFGTVKTSLAAHLTKNEQVSKWTYVYLWVVKKKRGFDLHDKTWKIPFSCAVCTEYEALWLPDPDCYLESTNHIHCFQEQQTEGDADGTSIQIHGYNHTNSSENRTNRNSAGIKEVLLMGIICAGQWTWAMTIPEPSLARFSSAHSRVLFPCLTSSRTATKTLFSMGGAGGFASISSPPVISAALLTDVLKLYCDDDDVSHRLCAALPAPSILPPAVCASHEIVWSGWAALDTFIVAMACDFVFVGQLYADY